MSHFSFIYNRVNRLKGVQEPGGIKTTFEYDKAGNRTAQIEVMAGAVKLTNYSYNNKNQLERETLQEAGKTIEKTYHYDANGNLVSKADHQIQALSDKDLENVALSLVGEGSTDALTLYQYNEYNQLIKTITGNQTIAYGYNIEGYRDAKHTITQNKIGSISEETLLFIYDGSKVILETDITGNIKAENTYGLNLIARKADNEKAYYLYNAHGDVTALTDPAGKILGTYQYDAFGNIREKTYEKPNPYTYAGYRYDEEIDLYYLNARYYDPKIARFITQDTYKGQLNDPLSLNLYTYCANNPISYYDPTGFAYVWNRYGEIIGSTSGNKDYTDYSKTATDTHGGSHMADKEWSSGGSKSSSSGSSKSGSSSSSGSSSQTSSSSYVMKPNQFNETIYKLVGLTTYFAVKSTNAIAEKMSSYEDVVYLSAPVTLFDFAGDEGSDKVDNKTTFIRKITIDNSDITLTLFGELIVNENFSIDKAWRIGKNQPYTDGHTLKLYTLNEDNNKYMLLEGQVYVEKPEELDIDASILTDFQARVNSGYYIDSLSFGIGNLGGSLGTKISSFIDGFMYTCSKYNEDYFVADAKRGDLKISIKSVDTVGRKFLSKGTFYATDYFFAPRNDKRYYLYDKRDWGHITKTMNLDD
ncbi:RHS repeat domain-containing protein [Geosporobacter ferrireducens]|uniref:Uncharacterized protein n=1 Tax=Geosporobacter ferrireducens TaxID=1424294 RepID=A0A1D8GGB9_9FIRM|nr:RHS repeat-associated core domain-containing protein [Geosporobacter ferrireducens]AOT69961.1 hypothetical protein Gferi_10415 [Geosporobacter ferrireducens]